MTEREAVSLILGDLGLLAQELPSYEPRAGQIDMAEATFRALQSRKHAGIEAGTGVGKSFGYLTAVALHGARAVISTGTIQLQEQLIKKDLPFLVPRLERVTGRTIRYAVAKGKGNYFCQRNARTMAEECRLTDPDAAGLAEQALHAFTTGWDGDRATLRLDVFPHLWEAVAADDTCTKRSCPYYQGCPLIRAQIAQETADVLVSNHALLMIDRALREETDNAASALPDYQVAIIDEAHEVADCAVEAFGREVGQFRAVRLAKRVRQQAQALGISLETPQDDIQRCSQALFPLFHGAADEEQLLSDFPHEIQEQAAEAAERLITSLYPMRQSIGAALANLDPDDLDDRELKVPLQALARSCGKLATDLRSMFEPTNGKDLVFVKVESRQRREHVVTLHRKPIDTAPIFARMMGDVDSLIFTSATLTTGPGEEGFLPVRRDLALPADAITLQAESPFDFRRQVTGYFPEGLPQQNQPSYHTAVADEVVRILNHTQGRAFVLFTSYRDMQAVHALVESRVRFPVLLQGTTSKDRLLEQFKSTPGAVLFGVKSFWTGVDVPGDALSCVVLVKLPFAPPSPLTQARCELIRQAGGNDFWDFAIPNCIQAVRQGFGRLIRTKQDRGLFVILDPRIGKGYGRKILRSLPVFPILTRLPERSF